jgi:hypothetical protein
LKCEAEKRKHLVIKLIILGIIFSFDDVWGNYLDDTHCRKSISIYSTAKKNKSINIFILIFAN